MEDYSDWLKPPKIFGIVLVVNSFAGLASALRSGQPLTYRSVASAIANSTLAGLLVAFLWYRSFNGSETNAIFLLGISGLAGVGGASTLDFLVQLGHKYIYKKLFPGEPMNGDSRDNIDVQEPDNGNG